MLKEITRSRLLSEISTFTPKYIYELGKTFNNDGDLYNFLRHIRFFSVDSKSRIVGLVNFEIENKKLDGIVIISHKNSPIPMLDLVKAIKKLRDTKKINEVEFMANSNHPMIERYKEIVLKYNGTIKNTNNNTIIMNIKFKTSVLQKIKSIFKGMR